MLTAAVLLVYLPVLLGSRVLAPLVRFCRALDEAGVLDRFGRTTLPGGRRAAGRLPGPASAWTSARDLASPPAESFRAWWQRTDGGRR